MQTEAAGELMYRETEAGAQHSPTHRKQCVWQPSTIFKSQQNGLNRLSGQIQSTAPTAGHDKHAFTINQPNIKHVYSTELNLKWDQRYIITVITKTAEYSQFAASQI